MEFGVVFYDQNIGCESKHFSKSARILDLTPESFSTRRELPESGPNTSVGILGVEFLTFEVEFRIFVPQTHIKFCDFSESTRRMAYPRDVSTHTI